MIIIRPITKKDQDVFAEFSFEATLGITNLPRARDKLSEKVLCSEHSFVQDVTKPGAEEYIFVLEDLTTGRIGGTCAILANANQSRMFCYNLENIPIKAKHISAPKIMQILRSTPAMSKASEVCALYLQPTFRHSGQGRLLSLSRFLFIAGHRQRFANKVIAEMRGYIDQRQISPFWDAVGRHFCNLSFVEVMAQLDQDRTFISEILPTYPIYVALLPKEAQEVIGKTHDSTKPALEMLLHEGFNLTNQFDVFDAGPTLIAKTSSIRSIKYSTLMTIETTHDLLAECDEFILSNDRIDFRAGYGRVHLINKQQGVINQDVANALRVKRGEAIRYVTLH